MILRIPTAASIINFVVITASLSAVSSGIFIYSRQLYNLSLQGSASSIPSKVSKKKIRHGSVLVVVLVQLLGIALMAILSERAFALCSSITVFMLVFS